MKKLTEYKKAEKGAMEIVNDYESMKMKYFKVLQENEKHKIDIQNHIQKEIDNESRLKRLNDEKQTHVDEMYKIRMELKKMAETVKDRDEEIDKLTITISD